MNLETEITFGQNPNKETKLQNPVPSILRDEKGKVRWKLPENTEKENLCMGIRNVQGLFLEKYPEFNEMFPKDTDGKIAEIQRKEAMKFIFERIGTSKKFVSLLGGTALHKKDVPYFQGSHPFVMNKSFASWGIEFNLTTRKGKMEQFYSDEDGRWVTRGFLLSKYEVDKKTLVHYLKNVKRKNVNGSNLYNE